MEQHAHLPPVDVLLEEAVDFQCPVPRCGYVQLNKRRTELRRHIQEHRVTDGRWVCRGVLLRDAKKYGITDVSDAAEYGGEVWVGGCWQAFSRGDPLKRHLKTKGCATDNEAVLDERSNPESTARSAQRQRKVRKH